MLIEVEQNGEILFRTTGGQPSPINILRMLWVQEDHWTLEIAFTTRISSGNEVRSFPVGRIYQDGVLLNDLYSYEEMFGFQMIDGKPFYFYKKDGRIHISYDNEDLPIFYDEIPHYHCCSGAEINPVQAGNWVGFFGRRGETWFYTELGKYEANG